MKPVVLGGVVVLSLSGLMLAQGRGRGRGDAELETPVAMTKAPEIPFDSVPDFLKLPDGINFGEVPGVAVDSKGRVFVFSRSSSAYGPGVRHDRRATARVRPEGRVHPRDRQAALRLGIRALRPHRQGRQHLGDRQGLGHGDQFQPGGPRPLGVRTAAGVGRRRRALGACRTRRCRRSTAGSASRPTSRGTRRATSTSPTAT